MEMAQTNCVKKKDSEDAPVIAKMKKMKQARLPFMPLEPKSLGEETDSSPAKKRKLSDNEPPIQKSKIQKSSTHLDKLSSGEDALNTSSGSEAENLPSLHNTLEGVPKQSNTISKYLKENCKAVVLLKPLNIKKNFKTIQEDVKKNTHDSASKTSDVIDLTNSDSQPPFERKELTDIKTEACDEILSSEETVEHRLLCNDDKPVIEDMDVSIEDEIVVKDGGKTECNIDEKSTSPSEGKENLVALESTPVSGDDLGNAYDSVSPSPEESCNKTPKIKRDANKALSESKRKEKEAARLKFKEEREREKEEKKQQKEKERLEKEKEKEEKKKQKEEQKAEKDRQKKEEKEKKEKERLEKQEQKEEEQRKKQEILDAKNEERRKKEEEKKMKEEEKQKEEEEKTRKQERIKAAFSGFFIKQNSPPSKSKENPTGLFMPFEMKKDMVLAEYQRRQPITQEQKDQLRDDLEKQESQTLYLKELREKHKPVKQDKSSKRKRFTEDVIITGHDSETAEKVTHHVKYLKFHENTRPAYYGTWRKTSKVLTPRNPMKQDTKLFDYEVDSDEEWEEEEPGESLSDSEGEEDKEKEDEEEDEEGWMVPHGYLSEDEGIEEDEPVTPELLKARQLAKATAWESELKRQTTPVATIIIGCYWEHSPGEEKDSMKEKLNKYQGVCLLAVPIPTKLSRKHLAVPDDSSDKVSPNTPKGPQKKPVPEEAMSDLVKLVHGSLSGIKKLIKEFRAYWKQKTTGVSIQEQTNTSMEIEEEEDEEKKTKMEETKTEQSFTENDVDDCSISKRQLEIKIMAIAIREKRHGYKKICWYVHENILKQYNLQNLTFPNTWEYVTKVNKAVVPKDKVKQEEMTTPGRKTPTILQFVQPMSPSQLPPLVGSVNKDAEATSTPNSRKTPNILKFMSPQSSTPLSTSKNGDLQLKSPKVCRKPVSLAFASPSPTSPINPKTDIKTDVKSSVLKFSESKTDSVIIDQVEATNSEHSSKETDTEKGVINLVENCVERKCGEVEMEVTNNNTAEEGNILDQENTKEKALISELINNVIVLD
ncbi:hypothetical protein ScPMuIL_017391 [Solemya velum]